MAKVCGGSLSMMDAGVPLKRPVSGIAMGLILEGKDFAVIGFRESPLARFLSPALTCFRMSLRDLGISLGESLLAAMPAYAHIYPHGIVNKIWPMELIPGESDIGPRS